MSTVNVSNQLKKIKDTPRSALDKRETQSQLSVYIAYHIRIAVSIMGNTKRSVTTNNNPDHGIRFEETPILAITSPYHATLYKSTIEIPNHIQ